MASLRKKMTSSFLTSPKKTTSKTTTNDETKQIQKENGNLVHNDTFEKQESLKNLTSSTTSSDYDEGGVYFSRSSKAARSTLNKVHHLVSLYATNVRESQHLSTFVELNYTGFFKILKKFNKKISFFKRNKLSVKDKKIKIQKKTVIVPSLVH